MWYYSMSQSPLQSSVWPKRTDPIFMWTNAHTHVHTYTHTLESPSDHLRSTVNWIHVLGGCAGAVLWSGPFVPWLFSCCNIKADLRPNTDARPASHATPISEFSSDSTAHICPPGRHVNKVNLERNPPLHLHVHQIKASDQAKIVIIYFFCKTWVIVFQCILGLKSVALNSLTFCLK